MNYRDYQIAVMDRLGVSWIRLKELRKSMEKNGMILGDEPMDRLSALEQSMESCLAVAREGEILPRSELCSRPLSETTGT